MGGCANEHSSLWFVIRGVLVRTYMKRIHRTHAVATTLRYVQYDTRRVFGFELHKNSFRSCRTRREGKGDSASGGKSEKFSHVVCNPKTSEILAVEGS